MNRIIGWNEQRKDYLADVKIGWLNSADVMLIFSGAIFQMNVSWG
jgi:hypothetical protein